MLTSPLGSHPIIGEAPAFVAMLEQVSHAAQLAKPVLVIGERGTGKELIASRLHYLSPRWDQPMVKVNCAALTEGILESELFGHEAGAFTGAGRQHIGRFERAHQGTLILDELGTVPLRTQEKILRVIEYGEFERVGGSETIQVDVRIVGATNENLPAQARRGRFRSDLLDRLAFDVIIVPPLRARPEDIPILAQHFAVNITSELGRSFFAGFAEETERELLALPWPGNVRELKNTIERSVYRAEDPEAPLDTLIVNPFDSPFSPAEPPAAPAGPEPPPPAAARDISLPCQLKDLVSELEVRAIAAAMRAARHNQKRAAGLLGLSYHQLRARLRKHEL